MILSVRMRLPAVFGMGLCSFTRIGQVFFTIVGIASGVIRPIWFLLNSVNHRLPSGPAAMARGTPRVGGIGGSGHQVQREIAGRAHAPDRIPYREPDVAVWSGRDPARG